MFSPLHVNRCSKFYWKAGGRSNVTLWFSKCVVVVYVCFHSSPCPVTYCQGNSLGALKRGARQTDRQTEAGWMNWLAEVIVKRARLEEMKWIYLQNKGVPCLLNCDKQVRFSTGPFLYTHRQAGIMGCGLFCRLKWDTVCFTRQDVEPLQTVSSY